LKSYAVTSGRRKHNGKRGGGREDRVAKRLPLKPVRRSNGDRGFEGEGKRTPSRRGGEARTFENGDWANEKRSAIKGEPGAESVGNRFHSESRGRAGSTNERPESH